MPAAVAKQDYITHIWFTCQRCQRQHITLYQRGTHTVTYESYLHSFPCLKPLLYGSKEYLVSYLHPIIVLCDISAASALGKQPIR